MTEEQERFIWKWRYIFDRRITPKTIVPPDPDAATFGQVLGGRA